MNKNLDIIDGWLFYQGQKVPAEMVIMVRNKVYDKICFDDIERKRKEEDLETVDNFLYQCMVTHSTMRERKG